ncbi:ribonuclease HIII [Bacilli bacterium]|nr:ribonuclease HIII [Bacilli bacterium]
MKKKSETSLTKNIINKDKIPTNTIEEYQSYIGSDEVGVGDYFGGLVVCAVYIDKKDEAKLKELGVKDSKDLTDLQMEYMYPEIIKIVKYSFLSYMPSQYNAFISKYKNTHILKAYMHNNCICRLNKKLNIQAHAVIDQFVNSDKYYSYFKELNIEPYTDITFEPKAENKYVAVACASIIARVEFLMQIKVIKKLLKIDFPLGSSDKRVIECAKYVYENYGKEGLYNNVKIDFKTTDKVISKK